MSQSYEVIFENNKKWVESKLADDPDFFHDLAMAQNPDYLIMEQRILIANSHLKAAKLALLPSLDFQADASGTRYGKYTMEGVGNFDTNLSQNISDRQRIATGTTPNFFLGGKVSWEADIWGKLSSSKRAALATYLATDAAKQAVQTQLIADIANNYLILKHSKYLLL